MEAEDDIFRSQGNVFNGCSRLFREKREEQKKSILIYIILTLGMDLLNAKGVTLSLIFLFLSLFLFKAITKEERNLRILFIFFSYLVTLSFLLTVVLY